MGHKVNRKSSSRTERAAAPVIEAMEGRALMSTTAFADYPSSDAPQALGGTGGGAGKVSMRDINIVVTVNKATPILF